MEAKETKISFAKTLVKCAAHAAFVDATRQRLYLASHEKNVVNIIDLSQEIPSIIATYGEGIIGCATGVVVNQSGTTMYVSDFENNCIRILRVSDGTQIKQIGSPDSEEKQIKTPCALTLDETNQRLYVCDFGNARISVFNLETDELLFSFGQENLFNCSSVTIHDKYILAGVNYDHNLMVFSLQGELLFQSESLPSVEFFNIAINATGTRVYATDYENDQLHVLSIDFNSKTIALIQTHSQVDDQEPFKTPRAIAVYRDAATYPQKDCVVVSDGEDLSEGTRVRLFLCDQ